MSVDNLDAVDLAAVPVDGFINESLMQKIYDVSPVDLPFTDAIGSDTSGNTLTEWAREALAAPNKDNARVDGSDSTGNDTVTGERLQNYHQIMAKTVRVSDRGRNSDTLDSSDELIRQLMKRQKDLKRDCEATYTSRNIAVGGDSTSVPGKLAGVGGWIGVKVNNVASTTSDRGATGADPVLSNDATAGGGFPTTAATEGTKRALTETSIKDMMREAYLNGGDPTLAMSTPACIQTLSDYLFTSSARVATLTTETGASNRTTNSTGGGNTSGGVTAQGSVNVLVTNFGVLNLVPNRFQPQAHAADADVADLYLIDTQGWDKCFLQGFETKELARTGIAENREITVDTSLIARTPEASAVIADVDVTLAATA